tara:strand:+ start:935 stop:4015 length:3081 start_codon:yes stop_codon:yes gene_type:complete
MAKISNTLSYPNQSPIESGDYLIGTSSSSSPVPKQTKTFTLGDIANFTAETILDGDAFRIAMFSTQNTLVNSLLFQDFAGNTVTLNNGFGLGSLTVAEDISVGGKLGVTGTSLFIDGVMMETYLTVQGKFTSSGEAVLLGQVADGAGNVGSGEQVLVSQTDGTVRWENYQGSGLEFQGGWNASTNFPSLTLIAISPANTGYYWIVSTAGTTPLPTQGGGTITDWEIGDWAIISEDLLGNVFWDKIDNSSVLTGSGTAGTVAIWTSPNELGDSKIKNGLGVNSLIFNDTTGSGEADGEGANSFGQDSKADGDFSFAVGRGAEAKADYSFALGSSAVASSESSIALMEQAKSQGAASFAVGFGAETGEQYAIAIGKDSLATGIGSIAIGTNTISSAEGAVSIGLSTEASADAAVALGGDTTASGAWSFAVGKSSKASGGSSVAMGNGSDAYAATSFAVGSDSKAEGNSSIAIGAAAYSYGEGSVSLGNKTLSYGKASFAANDESFAAWDADVALGKSVSGAVLATVISQPTTSSVEATILDGTIAAGDEIFIPSLTEYPLTPIVVLSAIETSTNIWEIVGDSVFTVAVGTHIGIIITPSQDQGYGFAAGYKANARAKYSSALGNESIAIGENSTALSSGIAVERGAFAVNPLSRAEGQESVAMAGALTQGKRSFAVGEGNSSLSVGCVALGINSTASGDDAVAIGGSNVSSGTSSFALGTDNEASGNFSIALGAEDNTASGSYSISLGTGNETTATKSNAWGDENQVNAPQGFSIGSENTVFLTAPKGMAIGSGSRVAGEQGLAVGTSLESTSYRETVLGSFNLVGTPGSVDAWVATDMLYVIGNGATAGNESNALEITKAGIVSLPSYGSGTVTGTVAKTLGVTAQGQVIETDASQPLSWVGQLTELFPSGAPAIATTQSSTLFVGDSVSTPTTFRELQFSKNGTGEFRIKVTYTPATVPTDRNKLALQFGDSVARVYSYTLGSQTIGGVLQEYKEFLFRTYTPAGVLADGQLVGNDGAMTSVTLYA